LIGREDLIGDPRYDTGQARLEHEAEVDQIVSEWTRQHTKEEAMRLVSGVGVPAGAVFDTMELHNDPNMAERGIMQIMHHPQHVDFKMPAWPVRIDGAPPRLLPAPMPGQHNAEVLGQWLGVGSGEVEALRQEGVL
jgi:formyl-CoA transferase